ncbi:hypothetical protein [Microcoleus sp. F4-D5]|uniref:hypothetical protein n=1 Tax=Microcoleus sp. F4-D5 TaxID=2818760 RepID=UPI002FD140AD
MVQSPKKAFIINRGFWQSKSNAVFGKRSSLDLDAIQVRCRLSTYVQRKSPLTLNSGHSVEASSPEETGCGGLGAVTPSKTNETAINPPYKAADRLRVSSPTH